MLLPRQTPGWNCAPWRPSSSAKLQRDLGKPEVASQTTWPALWAAPALRCVLLSPWRARSQRLSPPSGGGGGPL